MGTRRIAAAVVSMAVGMALAAVACSAERGRTGAESSTPSPIVVEPSPSPTLDPAEIELAHVEDLIEAGGLFDLSSASAALLDLEETRPDLTALAWPKLIDALARKISSNPARDAQIADVLREVDNVYPDLTRPLQQRIVKLLLPKIGNGFALADALAHVGAVAVPHLIALARQGGAFVPQPTATRADHARLALSNMLMYDRAALAPLLKALKHEDLPLIADLMLFYIELGRRGSEPTLIQALDAHGDTIMALQFLQSGNKKLEAGARSWAARHGYTITGSYSGPGNWGVSGPPRF